MGVFLSVVIPCYNERDTIEAIVEKVRKVNIKKEIIIVDNGSTDGTSQILKEKLSEKVDKIIYDNSIGKGGAVARGIEEAEGNIVIIQDADLEYDPNDYPKIIEPIVTGEVDVCYGSRFLEKKNEKGYAKNFMANRFLTFLSNRLNQLEITDMETCYKAFNKKVFEKIKIEEKKFGMEPEITAKVAKYGFKIKEVPISYYPRTIEEGKKIHFKDGFDAIRCIIKYNRK